MITSDFLDRVERRALRVSLFVDSIDPVREEGVGGEEGDGDETQELLLSATPEVLGSTCTCVDVETKIPVVGSDGRDALAPGRRSDLSLRLGGLLPFANDGDPNPVSNGTGFGC